MSHPLRTNAATRGGYLDGVTDTLRSVLAGLSRAETVEVLRRLGGAPPIPGDAAASSALPAPAARLWIPRDIPELALWHRDVLFVTSDGSAWLARPIAPEDFTAARAAVKGDA